MLLINCPQCHRKHLVSSHSVLSLHNTSEGIIAYVKCPEGHLVITNTSVVNSPEPVGSAA